jgi:hypothetical protein
MLLGFVMLGVSPQAAEERRQAAIAAEERDRRQREDELREERDRQLEAERARRESELEKKATAEKAERDRIEAAFDPWDGNHIQLERRIKAAMTDPGSYEHVTTRYWVMGDTVVIKTWYRGRNMMGGMVPGYVMARADRNGNLLEIVEEAQGVAAIAPTD